MKKLFLSVGVLAALIGGAIVAYKVYDNRDVNLGTLPSSLDQKPPDPVAILDPLLAEKTRDWKIYKNSTYGFEFKYPPALTLRQERERAYELLRLKLDDLLITISRKNQLVLTDASCRKVTFDRTLGAWVQTDTCSDTGFAELVCALHEVGAQKLPALLFSSGAGANTSNGGFESSSYVFLTNKDFAVAIERPFGPSPTAEEQALYQLLLETLSFQGTTEPTRPPCTLAELGTPLPDTFNISTPSHGASFSISDTIPFSFESPLPDDVGAALYLSKDYIDITSPEIVGEVLPGQKDARISRLENTAIHRETILNGDMWVHARLYRVVKGMKIFATEKKIVKTVVHNTAPAILELSYNKVAISRFPLENGRPVLRHGELNEGVMDIVASNVFDCFRAVTSMNKGEAASLGVLKQGQESIFVDPGSPKDALVTVTYTCKTPSSSTISKSLEFWNR